MLLFSTLLVVHVMIISCDLRGNSALGLEKKVDNLFRLKFIILLCKFVGCELSW